MRCQICCQTDLNGCDLRCDLSGVVGWMCVRMCAWVNMSKGYIMYDMHSRLIKELDDFTDMQRAVHIIHGSLSMRLACFCSVFLHGCYLYAEKVASSCQSQLACSHSKPTSGPIDFVSAVWVLIKCSRVHAVCYAVVVYSTPSPARLNPCTPHCNETWSHDCASYFWLNQNP